MVMHTKVSLLRTMERTLLSSVTQSKVRNLKVARFTQGFAGASRGSNLLVVSGKAV